MKWKNPHDMFFNDKKQIEKVKWVTLFVFAHLSALRLFRAVPYRIWKSIQIDTKYLRDDDGGETWHESFVRCTLANDWASHRTQTVRKNDNSQCAQASTAVHNRPELMPNHIPTIRTKRKWINVFITS